VTLKTKTLKTKIEALIWAGIALIGIGNYFIYPPSAPLSVGAILLIIGLYSALPKAKE